MCLAVPGQILEIAGDDLIFKTGRVSFGGVIREVNLAYTPEASVGDYVLVHAGFAIGTVDEREAQRVFGYLKEMNELAELEAGDDSEGPDAGRTSDAPDTPEGAR